MLAPAACACIDMAGACRESKGRQACMRAESVFGAVVVGAGAGTGGKAADGMRAGTTVGPATGTGSASVFKLSNTVCSVGLLLKRPMDRGDCVNMESVKLPGLLLDSTRTMLGIQRAACPTAWRNVA